jgi:hypothetical protein
VRRPGVVSFSGLVQVCVVVWVGHVSADRVLSETVVGDVRRKPPGGSQTVAVPARDFPQSRLPMGEEAGIKMFDLEPTETAYKGPSLGDSPGLMTDVPGRLRVSFSHGTTALRSSPTTTDTTDLVFDPVGSSFSLSGQQNSMGLSARFKDAWVGISATESEATGSVNARIENPNLRFINTDVDLSQTSVGLFVEGDSEDQSGSSRSRLGLERTSYRLKVSNDYRHGLFYGVPSVERSYRSTDLVVGLGHDYDAGAGLSFFIDQSYRLPIDDGFGVTGSAVSVGIKKDLGPDSGAQVSYRPAPRRCRGVEVFGSDTISTLSGSSSDQNAERSNDYSVRSALGWDGSTLGGRYRFGAGGGCGILWGALSRKTLNYGTGYIEQLQPVVYTDPFESTGTLTLDGLEFGLGRQLDLSTDSRGRGYLFGGLTTFVGAGDVVAVSQFGSKQEVTRSGSDAVLVGLRLGSGYERSVGPGRYLFYEISVSRFDARPFGTDLRAVEVGLDLGLGFN